MGISNYLRDCSKTIAGNYDKLFIANFDDISGVTFDGNELTAITMETDKHFGMVQADIDDLQFTSSGTASRSYFSEQQLIAKFSKKTEELEILVEDLLDGATCGLVAIRIDGNGNGWISGIAPLNKMMHNRPYLSVTEEFDSGASIEDDEEGNRYTITLSRLSATREFIIDSSVSAELMSGDATFVDWPAST